MTMDETSEKFVPDNEALTALGALPDDAPVVILNLFEFVNDGGESYRRYSADALPLIEARGGRVLYTGVPLGYGAGDKNWDLVFLVFYPSRSSFLDLVAEPEYRKRLADRSAGLKRMVEYAFRPVPGAPPLNTVSVTDDKEIFVPNLLRFKPGGRAEYQKYGQVSGALMRERNAWLTFALQGELPLVSDETWEILLLVRYPTLEALIDMNSQDSWQKANREHRQVGLDLTWAFPTRPIIAEG